MGIHHIGGEASRGLQHPHGHSNEQYKRRGDRGLESGSTIPAHCASRTKACLWDEREAAPIANTPTALLFVAPLPPSHPDTSEKHVRFGHCL